MNRRVSLHQLIACVAAALLLTSCGGGGGGSDGPSPTPPAQPPAPPAVQSIAPMEGGADTVITVTGSGLARVTTVVVGGMTATYVPVSDAQLTFRVPAGATSGAVMLSGVGFNFQATPSFRVLGVPTVATTSATNVSVSNIVNFTGQNLDRARGFFVGDVPLGIVSVSSTLAVVRTPANAVTGRVSIEDLDGIRRSSVHSLTVWMPISITGITPTSALPGDTITVTGVGLNAVNEVNFTSGVVAATDRFSPTVPSSATSTSLTVVVPSTASNGSIALFSPYQTNGVQSAPMLTVLPKVSVARLIPTITPGTPAGLPGETLYKQQINISGVGLASCENCHGPAYVFKPFVTATTISAAISANRGGMGAYSFLTTQQIADIAAYVAASTPSPVGMLSSVKVYGSKLQFVTGARVGPTPASVTKQIEADQSTSLTLTVSGPAPVGTALPVQLVVPGQSEINGGAINVQNNGAIYLFGVESAQVHSHQVDSPTLRLTPGRPFLLRAAVLATTSILSPTVQAIVSKDGVPRGTIAMTGPAVLQPNFDPYSNLTMFTAVIPGAWVEPGIQVTVSVATAPATQLTFSPPVGNATRMQLVLVPIQIGTLVGSPPPANVVQDALARIYPLARQNITVETRAPVALQLSAPLTSTDWGSVTLRLESLRASEAPGKIYYGVVPRGALPTSGFVQVGRAQSIPDLVNASTWLMSAAGWDDSFFLTNADRFGLSWSNFIQTMLHEVGHLSTRRHAPCGSASGPDPNFPAPDGSIGVHPLYSSTYGDASTGAVAAPHLPTVPPPGRTPNARLADLMGYCDGTWFGDYNYGFVQKFLENRTAATVAASVEAARMAALSQVTSANTGGYLVLSGSITDLGVQLAPAQVLPSPPIAPHSGGPYTMAVRTKAGETLSLQFAAPDVSDVNAKSFTVVLPNPGPVDRVEISKGLRVIPLAAGAMRAKAQSAGSAGKSSLSWAVEQEHVSVRWNSSAEPYLAVTIVRSDGARSVVASELTGGEVRVPVGAVSAGSQIELTLSDEFNARTVRVQ